MEEIVLVAVGVLDIIEETSVIWEEEEDGAKTDTFSSMLLTCLMCMC